MILGLMLSYLPALLCGIHAVTGRRGGAEIGLAELDRRLSKIASPLRAEARVWRDIAARAVTTDTV